MEVLVEIKKNGGFKISENGIVFVQTNTPTDYEPILSECFPEHKVIIKNENNTFVETNSSSIKQAKDDFKKILDDISEEEINIDPFNGGNTGRYKETFSNPESIFEDKNTLDETTPINNVNPVGEVDMPQPGDIIYIEGVNNMFTKITGGVVTVHKVLVQENEETVFNNEEYFYDENIMVYTNEFPNFMINWTEIKDKQELLKEKYGYRPAQKIL